MNASLELPLADIQDFIYISVCLVSLCIHSLILLMATEGQTQLEPQADNTVWTELETNALINYLVATKAKMGDSGMFNKQTFQAAAEHIQPLHTTGSAKTAKSCKTKYTSVCNIHSSILSYHSYIWP
jgi:hypothetical protein